MNGSLWLLFVIILISTYCVCAIRLTKTRRRSSTCRLAVFLGSGGHTSEILSLISTLDFSRYTPRIYIISEGDVLSLKKAEELELRKTGIQKTSDLHPACDFLTIPRARRVHQPLLTTPPTVFWSLLAALYHVTYLPLRTSRKFADVLVLNGPGTCLVLCIAAYVNRIFGIPSPKLIYVESFARVKSLSLSGKLLRPFVDRFIVQWPEALSSGRKGECRGWLV
ncbi:glycosyltransferase family 1 protein [Rickenella mellea]|uniref:UDP-N-acetylglucosamine transferase subunit ALG14 n=1 Tax=Rickenella mellea TaxID=50990 RepID=A0A4Y7QAL8_9AGAM|nr:glycosyltransferase family 1 protein [Rickenella mellea]